jgi:hypothetical protein
VSHEISEQIEHAAHGPGPGGLARWIGVTVAVLGVLMALCSAQVGAARTELIATMVKENEATLKYQTLSNKNLMLQAQLQHLHALMPDPKVMAATDADIQGVETAVKNPDVLPGIKVTRLETKKVLNTVTPTREDVLRFIKIIRRHQREVEAAKEAADSYDPAIKVHDLTAGRFEISQVAAEIGIVIASVGLLLANQKWFARGAWFTAMLLGALSLTIAAGTKIVNSRTLEGAEEKIVETGRQFAEMTKDESDLVEDEKLMEDIEKQSEHLPAGS